MKIPQDRLCQWLSGRFVSKTNGTLSEGHLVDVDGPEEADAVMRS